MAIKYISKEDYESNFGSPYESPDQNPESQSQFKPSEERGFLAELLNPVRFAGGQLVAAGRTAMGDKNALRPVKFPGILGGGQETPVSGESFKDLAKGAGAGLEAASWLVGGGEAKAALKGGELLGSSVMKTLARDGVKAGVKAYGRKAARLSPISLLYEGGKGLEGEHNAEEMLTNSLLGVVTAPAFAGIFERGLKQIPKIGGGIQKLAQKFTGEVPPGAGTAEDLAGQNREKIFKLFGGKGFLNRLERMQEVSPDANFGHTFGTYAKHIDVKDGLVRTSKAKKIIEDDISSLYGTAEKPGPYKQALKEVEPIQPDMMPDSQQFSQELSTKISGEGSKVSPINRSEVSGRAEKLFNEKFIPMLQDTFGYKGGKFNVEQLDAIRKHAGDLAFTEADEVGDEAAQQIGKTAREMLLKQAPELGDALAAQESVLQTRSVMKMINGEKVNKGTFAKLTEKGLFYTLLRSGPAGWIVAGPTELAAQKIAEKAGKSELFSILGQDLLSNSKVALKRKIAESAEAKEFIKAAEMAGKSPDEAVEMLVNTGQEMSKGVPLSQTEAGRFIEETIHTGFEKRAMKATSLEGVKADFVSSEPTLKALGVNEESIANHLKEMGVKESKIKILARNFASLAQGKADKTLKKAEYDKLFDSVMKNASESLEMPVATPPMAPETPPIAPEMPPEAPVAPVE